ncbi:MAG: L-histidine N(alpha)-methyltransferase [Burkholderiales bacterium]
MAIDSPAAALLRGSLPQRNWAGPSPASGSEAEVSEILDGLAQPGAALSPKYFYDAHGSALFEAITRTPEYYVTRTERAVMQAHGAAIAQALGRCDSVVEPGAGSCEKARALCRLLRPQRFVALDISAEFVTEGARALHRELPWLQVQTVVADITRPFALGPEVPRARRLVFYPGTSIGNYEPPRAAELLSRLRALVDNDGALLIGIDLKKDPAVLDAAYNDAQGLTAAFNLNMLSHVNRLVGADFDPAQWRHLAFYNAEAGRVEMHLQATHDLLVRWPGGQRAFVRGERIHTENSHKFELEGFCHQLHTVGFSRQQAWTDERRWFAVILARP